MGKYKFKNRKFTPEFSRIAWFLRKKKGITVKLGSETTFTGHFSREIIIHHNYDLKTHGLMTLIYQCGTALQPSTNIGVKSYRNIDKVKYPNNYKLGEFMCAVDAWDRGLEMVTELNLNIDMALFNREKEKYLLKYF